MSSKIINITNHLKLWKDTTDIEDILNDIFKRSLSDLFNISSNFDLEDTIVFNIKYTGDDFIMSLPHIVKDEHGSEHVLYQEPINLTEENKASVVAKGIDLDKSIIKKDTVISTITLSALTESEIPTTDSIKCPVMVKITNYRLLSCVANKDNDFRIALPKLFPEMSIRPYILPPNDVVFEAIVNTMNSGSAEYLASNNLIDKVKEIGYLLPTDGTDMNSEVQYNINLFLTIFLKIIDNIIEGLYFRSSIKDISERFIITVNLYGPDEKYIMYKYNNKGILEFKLTHEDSEPSRSIRSIDPAVGGSRNSNSKTINIDTTGLLYV